MLDGIVSLLGAVTGLVTALTGLIWVIFIVRRGSPKERRAAADAAIRQQAITPPEPGDNPQLSEDAHD